MITDRLPRSQAFLNAYRKSDRMTNIALPEDGRLIALAKDMKRPCCRNSARSSAVRVMNSWPRPPSFMVFPSPPYECLRRGPSACTRVVGAPSFWRLRTGKECYPCLDANGGAKASHIIWHILEHALPRVLPSTGFQLFDFRESPHTRGFYERAALLYHHARGTPKKSLFWRRLPGDRFRVDWARMRNSV
jgi:hypothetical protein